MQGWSALYMGLGLVGVVFGLASFLLGALGAPTDLGLIFANLGVGVALVVVALAMGFQGLRERMASGEARRVRTLGASALLGTLLGVVIMGLLAFMAARNPVRFDWSEAGVHSLTDQTRKVLESLERDVQVTAFYPAIEATQVRELLERYAYVSDAFVYEIADPTARPDLVERHGLTPDKLSRGLLHVALGEESVEVEAPDEASLTNAIVKLSRTKLKKVYFLYGHGERVVAGKGADAESAYARAGEALRNENYRVEKLLLGQTGDVPEDADVVVLAGPTRPLPDAEHRALERYVDRGGALLVMVDPRANTDIYDRLEAWGVRLGDDIVVDRLQSLFGRATWPFAGEYGDHPITEELREPAMFRDARSVEAGPDASGLTELVRTGPESWAERDLAAFFGEGVAELGPDDLRGPVPVAVAGTLVPDGDAGGEAAEGEGAADDAPAHARLVVYGDSDFASNQLIDAYRNRDLFVNSVNWLMGDVGAISVRPNQSRPSRLSQLSQESWNRIRYLSLFVLPEAIAVLGVLAWWSRRRAPGR